ncbi:MAG: amylo-alpha-1,6-glucosidase [Gaiellaceae bacterium]
MRAPHPIEVLYGSGVALACGLDGGIRADELHGLFAGDTRVLSTYRISVGGQSWQLLGRQRSGHRAAQWTFQSPAISDPGEELPEGCLFLRLDRRVDGALHDDITVCSYARTLVRTTLVIQLDADFADIFEVKARSVPPRLAVQRIPDRGALRLLYDRGGFRRGLHVTLAGAGSALGFVGSQIVFDLLLRQGEEQSFCLEARPDVAGNIIRFAGDPHTGNDALVETPIDLRAPSLLRDPFVRGCADLEALAVPQDEAPAYVAAGVPWFYTLFGRDSLLPPLMAGLIGGSSAQGALTALGALQAQGRDDWRDAEPGKLPHEVRRGELAHLDLIPHTPYYGTHDAPALYCLALWHAWRWTGAQALLETHLETARAALTWCDERGDRDGDGLQEYATRSRNGYYNQSWKDAGDAIVHENGELAEVPLATIELQGYLYAARLAMAELLDECGEPTAAERLRAQARELQVLVEERYWLPESSFYALALDADKRPVTSVGSNPGHLLWVGLPSLERGQAVARRLMDPDLFSGWGLRTLSAEHRRYNPLSYQRGSVWPHDTALAAAGIRRYGMRQEAATLIRALLEAARAFEDDRLPELFCGFDRAAGAPVPYREANIPQAWAAATPVLAVQLFLGLVPDAPRRRCFLAPWLPEWLPHLEVRRIAVGEGTLDVSLARTGEKTVIESVTASGAEVVELEPRTPLWGQPPHATRSLV